MGISLTNVSDSLTNVSETGYTFAMGKRLIELEPDEVSLVDSAANRRPILVVRAAQPATPTTGGPPMAKGKTNRGAPKSAAERVSIERVDAGEIEVLKALLGTLDEASAEHAALAMVLADLEAAMPIEEAEPVNRGNVTEIDEIARAKAAGASEAVLEILRSTREELEIVRGIAESEREKRAESEAVKRAAADYGNLGEHGEIGALIRGVERDCDDKTAAALHKVLLAAQERIARSDDGSLGGELGGVGHDGGDSATAEIIRKTEELERSKGLEYTAAMSQVLRSNPELKRRYYAEQAGGR